MNTDQRFLGATMACLASLALVYTAHAAARGKSSQQHYAIIFGTAYGTDDRPMYGVKVTIHPQGKKHPSWELISDHRGEFAQRVPPGPGDYVVSGQAEIAPVVDGKPQLSRKKRVKAETKVHIDAEERQDISLHMAD